MSKENTNTRSREKAADSKRLRRETSDETQLARCPDSLSAVAGFLVSGILRRVRARATVSAETAAMAVPLVNVSLHGVPPVA